MLRKMIFGVMVLLMTMIVGTPAYSGSAKPEGTSNWYGD